MTKFYADFHIHSHYSIATSKNLTPEYLDHWAGLKGIKLVGTGDFTHPGWLNELKNKLKPLENGLYTLKKGYALKPIIKQKNTASQPTHFLLTAEISCIYKKKGKVRKVHNVIFAPDFATVEKIQQKLIRLGGNITSDGRPILGLDSRDLLEICLEASENIFFVPAHIWTPWFSALGDKSGFDTIHDCYDDLTNHIFAVETGLSSDPAMNWICSFLDDYTLISNSDAHSPEKLGREANIFDTEVSYKAITQALKTGDPSQFLGTVEFFPQEGKYHYDGHRKCGVLWDPVTTLQNDAQCPVCHKKVTVGVMNRVVQLSDRNNIYERKNRHPFYSVISLKGLLSEIIGVSPQAKKVHTEYLRLLEHLGSEFDILLNHSLNTIEQAKNPLLCKAIERMRAGEVIIKEGFDGEYGKLKVFHKNECQSLGNQQSLFPPTIRNSSNPSMKRKKINFDLHTYRSLLDDMKEKEQADETPRQIRKNPINQNYINELNSNQKQAAEHLAGPALILAGPGTGKTKVLTCRIAQLILNNKVLPDNILAVTFTNKAATEMKERLHSLLSDQSLVDRIMATTFHALGYQIVKKYSNRLERVFPFSIIDDDQRKDIIINQMGFEKGKLGEITQLITNMKQNLVNCTSECIVQQDDNNILNHYNDILKKCNAFDFDDLIYYPVKLMIDIPEVKDEYQTRYQWILIDEYQDVNYAQYHLVKNLLTKEQSNIYAIGDANQAIYGFRGADVQYIKSFMDDFPDAVIYKLTKSYRCSRSILAASGQVITEGENDDNLQGIDPGVKVTISPHKTEKSEAEFIARTIESMIGGLRFFSMDSEITQGDQESGISSLADFAVLCRVSRQMKVIEKAFNDHSIPYQTITNTSFFTQEPIKSIIAFLKLTQNVKNTLLKNYLIRKQSLTIKIIDEILISITKQKTVRNKLQKIIDLSFAKEVPKYQNQLSNLLEIGTEYQSDVNRFLLFTELGQGVDTYNPHTETVTLMTIHAAKGLEFPCVFIAGCEDGLLPYYIVENLKADFEEEKRLLYVGMTRARKYLYLTHAQRRFIYGKKQNLERSRYINKIEDELLKFSKSKYKKKDKVESVQLSLFD